MNAGRRGCEPVETRKTVARPGEIDGELWARIEPLLPVAPRNPRRPGRKHLDSRKVLCGILFVLHTGILWEFLPQELGLAKTHIRRDENGRIVAAGDHRTLLRTRFYRPEALV